MAINKAADSDDLEPGAQDDATSSTSVMSLRLLETIASHPHESALTNLAQELGIPKARVHRHLSALKRDGYVTQNPDTSRYRIGWRMFLLGRRALDQFDVVTLARPLMEELRDTVGQTVVITTVSDEGMVVLNIVPGRSKLEIIFHPGTRFDFHTVAQGKIALAFGPPKLLERVLAQPLAAPTAQTIVDRDRLLHEVALVRSRQWAEAPEEAFTGVNALAAPVFQFGNKLFGSLAIVGSVHYLPAQASERTVAALTDTARRLSLLLGADGDAASD
ncbi:IclR family transcriptional regulator [Burkholderia sp. Ac-20379]|uniref:IclR family transcriptional regulator n=1 Tax=Burkholderia sp. Ac-20379 TaxID=2703900 RepID=UPI00197CFAD0|nr:IclR family transcriptional regulator [Burkholderia sp. Ac-20379]MBN3728182.1 IclR family transcriptional regulator [Burkholderia sp. Ac-20379]